jgi:hypothetical protein
MFSLCPESAEVRQFPLLECQWLRRDELIDQEWAAEYTWPDDCFAGLLLWAAGADASTDSTAVAPVPPIPPQAGPSGPYVDDFYGWE